MAPELVNEKKFNHKVDIWSCGIVMLMMLTGRLPFKVENNVNAIFASISSYAPSHKDLSCYDYLSHSSIDFLLHCLQQNPNDRSEAITLLEHDWIKSNAPDIEVPYNIANEIAVNLWKFSAQFKLEQAAYTYLATYVASAEDEKKLRQMFLNLDQNKDGLISKEEFITGMIKAKTKIPFTENDLLNIFSEMDADLSGNIDYTEFLRASMNKTKMLSEKNLKAAFSFFDQDHDGCISKEEIQLVFAKGNVILEDDMCSMMLYEINCNNNSSVY
jgi:calcium-dependent protein kinase